MASDVSLYRHNLNFFETLKIQSKRCCGYKRYWWFFHCRRESGRKYSK